MNIRIGKRRKIQFTDKRHPAIGIISTIIAVLSFVLMIALCVTSSLEKGNGGIMYGYLGVFNFILSLTGFIFALRCYRKEDIYLTTPMAGSLLNGVIIVLYMILYFWGTV